MKDKYNINNMNGKTRNNKKSYNINDMNGETHGYDITGEENEFENKKIDDFQNK